MEWQWRASKRVTTNFGKRKSEDMFIELKKQLDEYEKENLNEEAKKKQEELKKQQEQLLKAMEETEKDEGEEVTVEERDPMVMLDEEVQKLLKNQQTEDVALLTEMLVEEEGRRKFTTVVRKELKKVNSKLTFSSEINIS